MEIITIFAGQMKTCRCPIGPSRSGIQRRLKIRVGFFCGRILWILSWHFSHPLKPAVVPYECDGGLCHWVTGIEFS